MRLRRRSAGSVWLGFSGGDVLRADDAKRPFFGGMEKEMKALAAGTLRSRTRRLAEGGEVG